MVIIPYWGPRVQQRRTRCWDMKPIHHGSSFVHERLVIYDKEMSSTLRGGLILFVFNNQRVF